MSLQSDILSALSAVASGNVYAQFIPEKNSAGNDINPPFVVFRVTNKSPLGTLGTDEGTTNYSVVFECYAETLAGALTLAGQVQSAIEASGLDYYSETAPGEDFEPDVAIYMEPVYYGFWHT